MNRIQYFILLIVLPCIIKMFGAPECGPKGIPVKPIYKGTRTTAELQAKRSGDQLPAITRAGSNATPGLSFLSSSLATGLGSLLFVPNNPTGDVGATQYVFSGYSNITTFNKFTGFPDGILNISAATFAPGTNSDGSTNAGNEDVFILHNRFLQRWFYTYELVNSVLGQTISLDYQVSNTSTITRDTQWASYQIPLAQINPLGGGSGSFIDFQQPGYDQNATYNGVSTFNTSSTYIGSSLTVIPNSSFVSGTPNITVFPGLFPDSAIGEVQEGFPAPATNFDSNPTYGYFVSLIYNQPAGITGNQIGLYRILDAGTNTPTLGPLVTTTLPFSFAFNSLNASHKGNLFGTRGNLQVSANPILPHVRNHQLYYGTVCQVDSTGTASTSGDRIGIQWYQFDLTGDPSGQGLFTEDPNTVPVLIQNGTLFDNSASDPLFYNLPSLMTNKNGDMILNFCSSGVNAYVNAGYAFRSASDMPGMLRTPVYVTSSSFPENFDAGVSLAPGPEVQRWGDSSAAVVDYTNDLDFWLTQSFAALQNGWGMQTTQVLIS